MQWLRRAANAGSPLQQKRPQAVIGRCVGENSLRRSYREGEALIEIKAVVTAVAQALLGM
jgi:hypothetical protein